MKIKNEHEKKITKNHGNQSHDQAKNEHENHTKGHMIRKGLICYPLPMTTTMLQLMTSVTESPT